MNPNQVFTIFPDISYIHKKDHRDNTPEKSQWTISELEERDCFEFSLRNNWNTPDCVSWGLYFDHTGNVGYLGKSASKEADKQNLFLAKFVDSNKNNLWHGYPANHTKNQDRPPEQILNNWMKEKYFSVAKIRKISKGQKCKL